MALVVSPPDVDDLSEATFDELVMVVGYVRGEVGRCAAGPHHHVVLVLAKGGGCEPESALTFRQEPFPSQHVDGRVVFPALVEVSLAEPVIEGDPYGGQVVSDGLEHPVEAQFAQFGRGLVAGHLQEAVSLLGDHLLGHVHHVLALIAVGGQLLVPSQGLTVAGVQGVVESVHLAAAVVHVILASDVVAGTGHDVGQGTSQDCPTGMSHVDGPCGVYAYELHHHLLALAHVQLGVLGSLLQNDPHIGAEP